MPVAYVGLIFDQLLGLLVWCDYYIIQWRKTV